MSSFGYGSLLDRLLLVTSSAGNEVLTYDSPSVIVVSGTQSHTLTLPSVSGALPGKSFSIRNRSTGQVSINANDGGLLSIVASQSEQVFTLLDASTSNGTWDVSDIDNDLCYYTAGEALSLYDSVYITSGTGFDVGRTAGRLYKTETGLPNRKNFVGFVLNNAVAGGVVIVKRSNILTFSIPLVQGSDYYLDENIVGGISTTPPIAVGKYAVFVGKAISTTQLDVDSTAGRLAIQVGQPGSTTVYGEVFKVIAADIDNAQIEGQPGSSGAWTEFRSNINVTQDAGLTESMRFVVQRADNAPLSARTKYFSWRNYLNELMFLNSSGLTVENDITGTRYVYGKNLWSELGIDPIWPNLYQAGDINLSTTKYFSQVYVGGTFYQTTLPVYAYDINVGGLDISSSGSVIVYGDLVVRGDLSVASGCSLRVSGDLIVKGSSSISGTIAVDGSVYIGSASGATGSITSNGNVIITGNSTLATISANGYVAISGTSTSTITANSYSAVQKVFSWRSASTTYAKMRMGDIDLFSTTAGTQAVTLKAPATAVAYDYIFPPTAPTNNTVMRMATGGQGTFVDVLGTSNQIAVTHNATNTTFSIPNNPTLPGNVTATGSFIGPGAVPIGSIIALGDIRAWTPPASGTIKEGWAICDGSAFPAGSHASLTGNRPNLTDERFLQGNSATGTTGGDNYRTINTQLGRIDFSHGHTVNSHSHNYKHLHEWSNNYSNYPSGYASRFTNTSNGSAEYNSSFISSVNDPNSNKRWLKGELSPAGIDNIGEATGDRNSNNYYTSGVSNGINGSGSSARTEAESPGTDSASLIYEAGHAHSLLNSAGTGTTDIRPKYYNVIYLIRVI